MGDYQESGPSKSIAVFGCSDPQHDQNGNSLKEKFQDVQSSTLLWEIYLNTIKIGDYSETNPPQAHFDLNSRFISAPSNIFSSI